MRKRFYALLLTLAAVAALSVTASAGDVSSAGQVWTSSGRLNVRAAPSTSANLVHQLSSGSYVTLLELSGSWFRVEYADGAYGYCHANHISYVESDPATVAVSWGSLNVRSGPGTGYAALDALPRGTTVQVLSRSGDWSRILYAGTKTGYVSTRYLTLSGSIALAVPSYQQTDSRWAEVTLGSSGKTMAKIGCATTAIAMVESWRTGTVIYPHTMAGGLRYTASGSVYWPDWYTSHTSSAGYLSALQSQLAQGKCVLLGAKNSAGSQHWVVVTGFSGDSLTPGSFTINDPGSRSRTTLADFFAAYPYFYKYFTY